MARAVPFNNEYDATVQSADYPIHYSYMARLRPPVSANQELAVAKYCYNAGNVNLYQAQRSASSTASNACPPWWWTAAPSVPLPVGPF